MPINRRDILAGAASFAAMPSYADERTEYVEYSFVDYYAPSIKGTLPSLEKDILAAEKLAASMPTNDHLAIMHKLSEITERGSTGELFNMRWKKIANPLIVLFFHDVGYNEKTYPNDCTPWCAATVSWCLKRSGKKLPAKPASSQSFLRYGRRVTDPVPGDLCVFTNIGDNALGHVGLFMARNGDAISVLGGNQSPGSETNCGPGYRQSKISLAKMAANEAQDAAVSPLFFSAFIRP